MLDFRSIFFLLLFVYILGDFYFQSQTIARKKVKKLKWVSYHCIIYGVISFVLVKLLVPNFLYSLLWLFIIGHAVIDITKYYIVKKYLKNNFYDKYVFIIDQIIHLLILVFISYYAPKSGEVYKYNAFINDVLVIVAIPIESLLLLALKLLLIHKPINIFIALIMNDYKPEDKDDTIKAGRMIGTVERIIMLFFLSIKQYSSVGLVLTAKSIARYNKIAEDQKFAEYYLLGTLLSTICVLVVSLI